MESVPPIDKPPSSSPLQKHQPTSTPGELPPMSRQDHPTEREQLREQRIFLLGIAFCWG